MQARCKNYQFALKMMAEVISIKKDLVSVHCSKAENRKTIQIDGS